MTDHDIPDDDTFGHEVGSADSGEAAGMYVPWTPRSGRRNLDEVNGDGAGWADPFTQAASEQDREQGPRLRRPPSGMGRRDRREWNMLEAARVHRLRAEALRAGPEDSFGPGFISSPPKYLDRRSRKAWLAIERESSKSWWERQHHSTHNMAGRERGALAFALIAAALLGWWVIAGLVHHSTGPAATAVVPVLVSGSSAPGGATSAAAARAPASTAAAAPSMAGSVGPAGEPGRLGTMNPGWSPTPSGGVPAITVFPTPQKVDPAAVTVISAPAGPVTAADTATPKAAVAAWAVRMCPQPSLTQDFLAARTPVKPLMTAAGWAEITSTEEQGAWKLGPASRQTTRCGAITVTVSPDQPTSGGLAYVLFRGFRVVTTNPSTAGTTAASTAGSGRVVTVMSGVRTVLQQSDGRWLVDVTAPTGG